MLQETEQLQEEIELLLASGKVDELRQTLPILLHEHERLVVYKTLDVANDLVGDQP
jgi:hypothetical protein